MPEIIPPKRPLQERAATQRLLKSAGITAQVALLGMRGYYLHGMGEPGQNDRGIYDDAIFLVSPAAYASFNGNTDPSVYRPGIATLKPGAWLYKLGIHGLSRPADQRYPALVQAAPVTVARDGQRDETGWFGINIHRGAYRSTSSLGCQTIFPAQWEAFFALVKGEMARHGQKTIPYVLVD